MRRPTLKTIATEMNLSVSAVSRIINGKGSSIGLSDSTIKSTMAFANKIGYRPHKQAQSLRMGKTNTIGVILSMPEPNNSDMVYKLFKGISETARENNQALMFFDINNTDSALAAINQCINAGVDGIIATYRSDSMYLERLKQIINKGMKVVMVLNRSKTSLNCPSIVVDHEKGGFIATMHLIKKGYKRIAHLASLGNEGVGDEHFKGYKRALETAEIHYDERLVIEDNADNSFSGSKKLLQLNELPDAVFCWNDRSAVKARHTFDDANKQIEIVGFDNREFIQYIKDPFSSVDFPLLEVGRTAVKTLLSGKIFKHSIVISPRLVIYNKE